MELGEWACHSPRGENSVSKGSQAPSRVEQGSPQRAAQWRKSEPDQGERGSINTGRYSRAIGAQVGWGGGSHMELVARGVRAKQVEEVIPKGNGPI